MRQSSVAFIFNNEDKLLLLKRHSNDYWMPNKWGLPGGGSKYEETSIQTLIREVFEETGLSVNNVRKVREVTTQNLLITYYFVSSFIGNVKIDKEHTDFKWFYINDIIDEECTPYLKEYA